MVFTQATVVWSLNLSDKPASEPRLFPCSYYLAGEFGLHHKDPRIRYSPYLNLYIRTYVHLDYKSDIFVYTAKNCVAILLWIYNKNTSGSHVNKMASNSGLQMHDFCSNTANSSTWLGTTRDIFEQPIALCE